MPKKQSPKPWELQNKRSRKKGTVPIRKRYLICTEGKTEAVYFKHYRSSTGPDVIPLDKSNQNLKLVQKTIDERTARIKNGKFDGKIDQAWVVLDRDAHPENKSDKDQFNQALSLAKENNIGVAYSNDSFELWLLLHYQELSTHTHRNELNKKLSEHRKKPYEKPSDLYEEIKEQRPEAIKRAKKLLKTEKPPEKSNPSTTVHILVEKLMQEPGYRKNL